MTAPARGRRPARRFFVGRAASLPGPPALVLVLALALGPATAARAQWAASVAVASDNLYRGYSISDGQPTLAVGLTYDAHDGAYGGVSLLGAVSRREGARFLGDIEYVGYAWRARGGATLDVGVHNLHYRGPDDWPRDLDAVEAYAGLSGGGFNVYVHYSPNYFAPGDRSLYAEVNTHIDLNRTLRLTGHAGVLTPMGRYAGKELYDGRIGLGARFRRGEVELSWSITGPYLDDPSAYSAYPGGAALALSLFF